MIENPNTDPSDNTEKDQDDWVSGDEPMMGAQASYLKTLSGSCISRMPTPRS